MTINNLHSTFWTLKTLFLVSNLFLIHHGHDHVLAFQTTTTPSFHTRVSTKDTTTTIDISTTKLYNNKPNTEESTTLNLNRRQFAFSIPLSLSAATVAATATPLPSWAVDEVALDPVMVTVAGDVKKLFNEGRVMEGQGNIFAAQRLFAKVTKIAPRFIYGWSELGNTQVAAGALPPAEISYSKAIDLCIENRKEEERFGVPRCNDLYTLYLNRGSLRLNNKMTKEALADLQSADNLRGKPDAIILQNLARAKELNGVYASADRDYTFAIGMTSNEVAPFWLRSALVKFQIGDSLGAMDLIRRVENRFPEAPEVRAALASMLSAKGDQVGAQRKYLEIPDRQRLKYIDDDYLNNVVSWPPKMKETVKKLGEAVGDAAKVAEVNASIEAGASSS